MSGIFYSIFENVFFWHVKFAIFISSTLSAFQISALRSPFYAHIQVSSAGSVESDPALAQLDHQLDRELQELAPRGPTLEVSPTPLGMGLWDMYQGMPESADMLWTHTTPAVRGRGRRGKISAASSRRAPRLTRSQARQECSPVVVLVQDQIPPIPPSTTPAAGPGRGRGRGRRRISRNQMPPIMGFAHAPMTDNAGWDGKRPRLLQSALGDSK
jgi:hypothetical protein